LLIKAINCYPAVFTTKHLEAKTNWTKLVYAMTLGIK